MVRCGNCGSGNSNTSIVCSHCGQSLFPTENTAAFRQKQEEWVREVQYQQQEKAKKTVKRTIIALVLVFAALIAIVAFADWYQSRPIPDPRLTGTWTGLGYLDNLSFTFTSDGNCSTGGTYQAKDGKLTLLPDSLFEQNYTYAFGTATDGNGNSETILILTTSDGVQYFLHKTA